LPLLPLFPLDVVLLPGTPLPLHIFEPRYKEMIGECRSNGTAFGVIRALEHDLAEIGCTAEIVSITKEYEDGRLDLVAEGRNRFEVIELNQERAFLRADILFLPGGNPARLRPRTGTAPSIRTVRFSISPARRTIFPAPIRRCSRFILPDRCRSILISSRNCWRCVRRQSACRPSPPTLELLFPICAGPRMRAKKPAATATCIEHVPDERCRQGQTLAEHGCIRMIQTPLLADRMSDEKRNLPSPDLFS
jgi:hypothetical protein